MLWGWCAPGWTQVASIPAAKPGSSAGSGIDAVVSAGSGDDAAYT